jgi:hypothetical protein
MVRLLKGLLILAVLLVGLSLLAIWYVGAWNLVFPNRSHDTTPPVLPTELASPSLLVFSKTNGFRHEEGIEGGAKLFETLASEGGWGLFHTENGAVFNDADLQRFDVVVFLNASGDMLNSDQEQSFQAWMEQGGGWLGIHAAGDSSHLEWQWYRDNLIGADFTAHIMGPQFQFADVIVEAPEHPVMSGLPGVFQHEEEWYSWAESPRNEGFRVLATIDENSYTPVARFLGEEKDLRMGDHPVVWSNCIAQGRSVYATMGHRADAFEQPQVRQIISNALRWLTGPRDAACP